MKIIDKDNDTVTAELPEQSDTEIIAFKSKAELERAEMPERIPVDDLLEAVKKQELSDIIVVGKGKDGGFYLSASCENGMLTYFMINKALFALEHGIL